MVPQKAVVLPPLSSLPPADPGVRRAVEDVALLASGLIDSVDAAMLTIAVPSDRWGDAAPLIAWNQRLVASPELSDMLIDLPMFTPAIDALCLAADALFARLEAWHWADMDAPGLCLVTDGVGVVLSTRRPPEDADCGWLLDLARLQDCATLVRPPHKDGVWSLIMAELATIH